MTGARLLLDTHAFVWYATGRDLISSTAREAIAEAAEVYVSAATVWEVRTKFRLGKLPDAGALVADLGAALGQLEFLGLPLDVEDGNLAGAFAQAHRDPFDRMLAAQALRRLLPLVSRDVALDAFGVARVW